MAEEVHPLLLEALRDIKDGLAANTKAVNDATTANAVLAERVGNLSNDLKDHIADDKDKHGKVDKNLGVLNTWRTDLKAKIATYSAIAGAVISIVVAGAKEALAAMLQHHQ